MALCFDRFLRFFLRASSSSTLSRLFFLLFSQALFLNDTIFERERHGENDKIICQVHGHCGSHSRVGQGVYRDEDKVHDVEGRLLWRDDFSRFDDQEDTLKEIQGHQSKPDQPRLCKGLKKAVMGPVNEKIRPSISESFVFWKHIAKAIAKEKRERGNGMKDMKPDICSTCGKVVHTDFTR